MALSSELKNIEKSAAEDLGRILHPAGGLTDDFVYEPISLTEYVYKTKAGKKGITKRQIEYQDPEEKKKIEAIYIMVEGRRYDFQPWPPRKGWLFSLPNVETVHKWVENNRNSLPMGKLWNLNSIYLRTFLDFPHKHEFSPNLLFITQSWLVELLPVVWYLGIKGEFGGGKTVTGEAIVQICRHGYLTGNVSPPFVARSIEREKITLMVDELDSVAGTKDSDLNSIFRQGYRRGMKYSRVNPNTLETESYDIFGCKLFTVHTEAEEALQTRTLPIHVRETSSPQFPIANLDKYSFADWVRTENFLWYLDSVLQIRDQQGHALSELLNNPVDLVDLVDVDITRENVGNLVTLADDLRKRIYQKKTRVLSEGQLSQLCQLTGRNTELMYMTLVLSNIVGVNCDEDIKKTFEQKIIEEGERTEIGYLGLLREVLRTLWEEKHEVGEDGKRRIKPDYQTADGYVKISNKECYDRFIEQMKKEYGEGVSPAKFKEYLLEFGLTDALNRTKLKVPIGNGESIGSRICNIFTERVLRKLGIEEQREPSFGEKLNLVKNWIMENKDSEGLIDMAELAKKIAELGEKPQDIIDALKEDGFIAESPKIGKWLVTK